MRSLKPVLTLAALAVFCGEVLTGVFPIEGVFGNPVAALWLSCLYGSGAILVREVVIRWRGSWPSMIVLGLAYGLIEEGLLAKAIYDPSYEGAGVLGTYGRVAEIGLVWTLFVIVFHAVVSVVVPILLSGVVFWDRRDVPWTGRAGLAFVGAMFVACVVFGALVIRPVDAPPFAYALTALVVAALLVTARRIARPAPASSVKRSAWRGWRLFALAATASVAWNLVAWSGPEGRPAELTLALQLTIAWGAAMLLRRSVARVGPLEPRERVLLAAGFLSYFVAVGLLLGDLGLKASAVVAVVALLYIAVRRGSADRGELSEIPSLSAI